MTWYDESKIFWLHAARSANLMVVLWQSFQNALPHIPSGRANKKNNSFWPLSSISQSILEPIGSMILETPMENSVQLAKWYLLAHRIYLYMNADTWKQANKKLSGYQSTAERFQDCILAKVFCFFCFLHGQFTCMQPKLFQMWLVKIIRTTNRNRHTLPMVQSWIF